MCLLGHPIYFVTQLKAERFAYDDGLMQRIIMLAPAPASVRASVRRQAKKPTIRILLLFFLIDIIHQTPRDYTFEMEASELIDELLDFYNDLVTSFNQYDPYLG